MSKVSLCALFAASVFAVSAADLDEYVQPDLVAMWDGYRNQGADKPHDSTATVWYDTTGQYGFVLNGGATMGDDCCKFAFYGGNTSYGTLSAEDTAATFDLAKNGTMEIVFYQLYDGNAVLLQSSGTSGIAFGRNAASTIITSNTSGSPTGTYAPLNKFSSIAVNYELGKSVAVYANGEVLTLSSANNYGTSTTETFIGNRAAKNGAFNGYIHAIRLYSRQLTPEEIAQNAAVDRERYFNRKPEATASYPVFDGMAGVTVDQTFTVGADLTVNAAHAAAVEYLTANEGATAAVVVPEGTYALTEPILLAKGEKLIGAGRDKTFLDCVAPEVSDGECAVKVQNDDNLVRGITLFNILETTKNAGYQPHAFYVTKGVVDNCRSTLHRSMYGSFGVALYQTGGTVTNCLLDHVAVSDMSVNGLIARVNGGLLVASDICYNDDGIGRSFTAGGLYLGGADAIARTCRIHDCGKSRNYEDEQGAGVYIGNGTLENSLIYNNLTCNNGMNSAKAAGVRVAGGTMRYCTIVNNKTVNDSVGYSGLVQSAGTVQNCIIVDNWSTTLGANVTGGTFEKNLVNKAVAGKDDNFTTLDAKFADAGAHDYHIAAKASVAVGKAVPVEGVTTDFDGVARDAEKPTIGAFEYVAQASEFLAEIQVAIGEWREGSAPTVELIYDGVTDLSKLDVTWYVDGEEWPDAKDAVVPAFAGLSVGTHDIKAVATYEEQTKEPEVKDALTVKPVKVYVDLNGSNTFPYATPATAAHVLSDAYGALWKNMSETTAVEIAAGEYALGDTLNVDCPVVFAGAGRDATTLTGFQTSARLVTLKNDGAVVRNLTLNGCGEVCGGGVEIAKGLVENCQITNCYSTTVGLQGVGVKVGAGAILDCEIVDCRGNMQGGGSSVFGGGVAVVGNGVVRNCEIHHCWASGWGGPGNKGGYGAGLYATAGLTENSIVHDCGDHLRPHLSTDEAGAGSVYTGYGSAILRNVLVAGNVSEKDHVLFHLGGKLENVTVTGSVTPEGVAAAFCQPDNINQSFCDAMMTNCVMWGNSGVDFEAKQGVYSNTTTSVVTTRDPKIGYCCWPMAEEGVDGNTAGNPRFRVGKNRGLGVISSYGSCFRTGIVLDWMEGATDLRGNLRLTDGAVDRGCYQVGFDPGMMLLVR